MNFNGISLIETMIHTLGHTDVDSFNDSADGLAYRIKEFIDQLPGGFLIYKADENEELIYANKSLVNIFRCDTFAEFKELTGNSFKGVVYYEDLTEVENSIAEQIENNKDDLDYVEYRIMTKDGTLRWVEDFGHFVRTETGGIYYVFITDATEKINKRNAERLALISEEKRKHRKLETLLEQYDKERMIIHQEHLQRLEVIEGLSVNYDSILYIDLDANKAFPYRLSSRLSTQFDRKLQVKDYDCFINGYAERWVHPDDKAMFKDCLSPSAIKEKLASAQTFYFNFKCMQDGGEKVLQVRIVNVGSSEKVAQLVLGVRNIDEEILKELRQKNLLSDALSNAQLANKAKNAFLSNISHDMRTPLNAIFGFTALAKKSAKDKSVADYLEKIETAGKDILEMIERVLQASYSESTEFVLNECECTISGLIGNVVKSIETQANKKNIDVKTDVKNIVHNGVIADREKIEQVLSHIANNAVIFTANGGKIRISAEEQGVSNKFAKYRFIIRDNGKGIDKNFIHRIFDPFEREHTSTASGKYGSGLGLTIAKHIIDMMGGTIEAQSETGKGSEFTVNVSFRLTETEEPDNCEEEFLNYLKGKKVLLVEDNEFNLEIATEMLEDTGLIVDEANNGQIALDKMKASSPCEYLFILMDIQMPVMDGRKATEEIRKLDRPDAKDIPIIALSANSFDSDKRISIEAGMNDHLAKPIDIPLVLKTVNKLIKR